MQILIDNFLVNYELFGEKNTPELLILHGWGRNLQDWTPTAKYLSSKYKVYLIDLPGFGGTHLPAGEPMGTYDYADFTEKFLEKLNIRKPTLLGHSFGGRIGIILGTKRGLLGKLVLVDSAGIEQKSLKVIVVETLSSILKFLKSKKLIEILRTKLGSEDYLNAGLLRGVLIKVVNEDLRKNLKLIKTPTLIIWGDKDMNQQVKYAKIMSDEIPEAKLRIVWDAGHSPHADKPKEFYQILKEELL